LRSLIVDDSENPSSPSGSLWSRKASRSWDPSPSGAKAFDRSRGQLKIEGPAQEIKIILASALRMTPNAIVL
jgi:hypothetical protein